MKQRQFRELIDYYRINALQAILDELKSEAATATRKIIDIISDEKASMSLQRQAALDLLGLIGATSKMEVQVTGPGGGPIQHDHDHTHRVDLSNLTPEQIEAFARGRIAAGGGDVDNLPQPGRITIDARVQQALPEPGGNGNGSSAKAKGNGKLKAKKAAKKRGAGKKG